MNDMTSVIIPKSDQINADDLIGGDMLITIRDVQIKGGQEQPVSIYFDGSDKAFRPCKSMSRVLVAAWGPDAKAYVGRSLQLYRDPTVKWAGMEVGGIRIRAMTDIQRDMTMALTATKGSRKPYTVKPLAIAAQQKAGNAPDPAVKWADAYITKIAGIATAAALEAFASEKAPKLAELRAARPELHAQVSAVLEVRRSELAPAASTFEDDFDLSPQPAADEPAPHVEAEPEPEGAAPSGSKGSLQERMARVAAGTAHQPEGRDTADMGEQPTLDQAKAALDDCRSEDAVATMLDSYRGQISDEDLTALSIHANNLVAERWPS
jgi:hypothetical protein